MKSVPDKVLAQTKLFTRALPRLLKKYFGRWVIFIDGKVHSDHDNEEDAYTAALSEYGVDGGYVVARVVKTDPIPITAGVMFGLK